MNSDYYPRRRAPYYPVGLGIVFAVCVTLLLIGVTGGLVFYIVAVAAALTLLGLLHYAVWGHNTPATALPRTARPDAWQRERDRENRH
jgi:hypothetical protein